jgi:glycosyltransferase involved in cell wall biosynthesis
LDFIGEIPGYDSACCCPPTAPLIALLAERGIRYFPTFQTNLHERGVAAKALALLGLLRAMRSYRPHILHVNQAGTTRLAVVACRISKIPCVVHVRLQEDVGHLNRLCPPPQVVKGLIAISQPMADLLQKQPNLATIPCTMLLDGFHPTSQLGMTDHSLPAERSTRWDFACVGRMCESKGQELLIRALHLLQNQGVCPHVVFVGEINEYGKRLVEMVTEHGLDETVEFVGHQDRVNPFLAEARWLICPSRYEPLGRVLFEAWDVGIPVIAGGFSGGAGFCLTASGGGLAFQEWTAESLAATLAEALRQRPLEVERLAGRGRAWLLEETEPKRYAQAIAAVFDRICAEEEKC